VSFLSDSMSAISRRHGLSRAAMSKRCQEVTAQLGVLLLLQGNCFRARRTGNGQIGDRRRGVRGYGWDKALVITYQVEGKRRIFSTGEGGTVSAEILLKNP
jgi:hypothetical protein